MSSEPEKSKAKERFLGTIFLGTVTGGAVLFGFSTALASARKKYPGSFGKGAESGSNLAARALGWGSLYAFGGVGLICVGICTALGVRSLPQFRERMESILKPLVPTLPKSENPGRSDFKSFRELFEYLSDEDERKNLRNKDQIPLVDPVNET